MSDTDSQVLAKILRTVYEAILPTLTWSPAVYKRKSKTYHWLLLENWLDTEKWLVIRLD